MEHGFQGKDGQQVPDMPAEFVEQVSQRYIELYERITGDRFVRAESGDVLARMERNVTDCLLKL